MISDSTILEQIAFSSELKNINQVEQLVDKICDLKNINEDLYGNMLIAVTEAVNNAIIHGNCFQTNENVVVLVSENDHKICFTVKDNGQGFDFEHLPDPTAPENIEKEHGRGVFLIRNLSDELVYEDGGKTAMIYFQV